MNSTPSFPAGFAGFTDALENAILDHVLGGGDYTREATIYVALVTANGSDSAPGTEVSGNAYARVAATNNSTNFPAASGGAKSNGTAISFPTPTPSGWGTVVGVELWSASSGGTRIAWGALTSSKTINAGDPVSFPIGDLDFTLD